MDLNVDDAYDLLGHNDMPVRQNGLVQVLRAIADVVLRLSGASALVFLLYYAYGQINDWRERKYKKSVRRKYGIPDGDNDPFNVAYAKVRQQRKDKMYLEVEEELSSTGSASDVRGMTSARQGGTSVSMPHHRVIPLPTLANDAESSGSTTSTVISQQNAEAKKLAQQQMPAQSRFVTPKAKPDITAHDYGMTSAQRKRPLEEQEVGGSSEHKASKEAASLSKETPMKIDGKANTITGPSRGSKRQAASDEDISINGTIGKKVGKRARRQSKKVEEVIDVDENGEHMDVDPILRGKKRDRTEADSSFGGDDELAGSRSRKTRRQGRKSNLSADLDSATPKRGTKRSYEGESTLGSEDGSKSPRKRGKHTPKESHDASVAESMSDASCAGRSIGEEWHANGVTYKVGPDGQRLRQVLLRKRASRYSMPEDSQHPDSRARLEILVETWLNEDEYKAAEKRGEVYAPSKKSKSSEDASPITEPGKQLLWANRQNANRTDGRAAVTPATNGKPRVDPFTLTGKVKRTPDFDSLVESPTGSPGIRQSKSYSKWEKQDLEAEAMARLRKKLEGEKKVLTPPTKLSFQSSSSITDSSSPAPSMATSSSAPASFATSSTQTKPAVGSTTPTISNAFVPTQNGNVAKTATTPSQDTAPSVAPSGQLKPPAVLVTPPQPPKAPSPAFSSVSAFGTKPSGPQPASASAENKQQAAPSIRGATPSSTGPFIQNAFGLKSQDSSTAAANPFAKPSTPSGFSGPTTNGISGDKPPFSFRTTGASQGAKSAATAQPSSFGKLADKPTSSVSSAFTAPVKDTSGSGSSTVGFGVAPQNSFGTGSSKPTVGVTNSAGGSSPSVASIPQAKSGFGAGLKPATPTSTPQTAATTSTIKPTTSAFNFPNPTATNAPANVSSANNAPTSSTSTGSDTTPPLFSFGQFNTQPSTSAAAPTSAGTAPKSTFGAPASQLSSATTAPNATTYAPTSTFGAPATQASSSTTSVQPAMSNTGTAGFGTATSAPATTGAPASTGFSFGSAKLATPSFSSSPFGNTATTSTSSPFNFSGKPSGASSSPFQFGAISAPTVFGGASNTATSAPSFGATAKAAGESSKPFTLGSSNPSGSAFTTTNGTAAPAAQNPTAPFNFGASSTPSNGTAQGGGANAFGTKPAFTFGAGSPFGAPAAAGNAGNTNTQNTSAFGSNTGTSVFAGQKS
ncbi:hypothetical protein ACEPAF_6779 [Sanghuangporus sanghuang]|uniref:Uncharacterized protein n=1 Tax=Sanghuangporus baumii TaxID=108892 RepID=A0A9Q5N3I0_SANBA|nr:hypothetical protein A7U60_g8542 [Sanghuangporus baumii]